MKHDLKIKDLFNKKEKIGFLVLFISFISLGIYFSLSSLIIGLYFMAISILPPLFLFIKRAKRDFREVWRITRKNEVARINVEYWEKDVVQNLDRNYFWSLSGKLIPIGEDVDGEFKPIYVFNLPFGDVTSGHLYRSGVQEIAIDLMKKEKDGMKEVVKLAGMFIVVAVMIFIVYSMWGRMLEAFN
tara:strand:+ start:171 stop:728 length:558 start_codon:yes stop_codon:yes gene_type:complete